MIILFGSARYDFWSARDIDLLLVCDSELARYIAKQTLRLLDVAVQAVLRKPIHVMCLSFAEYNNKDNVFLYDIRNPPNKVMHRSRRRTSTRFGGRRLRRPGDRCR